MQCKDSQLKAGVQLGVEFHVNLTPLDGVFSYASGQPILNVEGWVVLQPT